MLKTVALEHHYNMHAADLKGVAGLNIPGLNIDIVTL
jgi:hypothetical protein